MALAGAFAYLAQQARDGGDEGKANGYGIAATSMVYCFTFVFGGEHSSYLSYQSDVVSVELGCVAKRAASYLRNSGKTHPRLRNDSIHF
jgi:hypothetical protein